MEFAYSPSRGGGPLHLSPTHPHHIDTTSAIRKLRRSMSKSPSKKSYPTSKSHSTSPVSSLFPPNQQSPLREVSNISPFTDPESPEPTPTGTPIANTRQLRPAPKRTAALQRTKPISRSPMRRALSDCSDQGNGSISRASSPADGQENQSVADVTPRQSIPADDSYMTPIFKTDLGVVAPVTLPVRHERDMLSVTGCPPAKSSPLKRSDGFLNFGNAGLESPSAKRRSVHGSTLISSFDAPCQNIASSSAVLDEAEDPDSKGKLDAPTFSTPRGYGAVSQAKPNPHYRVTERPSASRVRRSVESVVNSPKPNIKGRPRSSLDSSFARGTLGSSPASDMENDVPRHQQLRSSRMQPHPLSRALSPSSPTPSKPDGDHHARQPLFERSPMAPRIDFAKSLPVGALRPQPPTSSSSKHHTGDLPASDDTPFATPNLYKIAKPDPAAFRSTGLISKRHRNPDELPPPPNGVTGMPDTPCKKIPPGFSYSPSPRPSVDIAQTRFAQPEFGTPSRPFNPNSTRPTPMIGRTANVFGSNCYGDHQRRASFASVDGEECSQWTQETGESQSSVEESPPTPTKHNSVVANIKPNSLRSSIFGRRPSIGPNTFAVPNVPEQYPTSQNLSGVVRRPSNSDSFGSSLPQTPADVFPDPSSLSISPQSPSSPIFQRSIGNDWARPPETPTAHRDAGIPFFGSNPSMTPSNHGQQAHDVDPVLISRFKKAEWYGRGTFSEVYRVYQQSESVFRQSYFSPSTFSRGSPNQVALPDKVFIVKKSKSPYHGSKVRRRKLQEVSIMSALGKNDHIVHLIDSWEAHHHLYIQTEFCEEGSLHEFLAKTGHKGRLDDFRIWKILIEMSLGVKHIHDCGFIHLDLKPANVFIDFAGVLKIGDFGHATQWPAPDNAEGEGDRRYMGPDLLQGSMDKPADVFALGMMMFEIAGNCIPPDNGVSWHKLRSGDWSGLPSLTSGSTISVSKGQGSEEDLISGHDSPEPITVNASNNDAITIIKSPYAMHCTDNASYHSPSTTSLDLTGHPPRFMLDPEDPEALDAVVHWMMAPLKEQRPVIDQILETGGVRWVNERRRAGAVVFEGTWGPESHVLKDLVGEDEVVDEDAEMLDV